MHNMMFYNFLYYILFIFSIFSIISATHKICVPESSKQSCLQMAIEGSKQNVNINCTIGRDRLDCLEKIQQHNADFGFMEPEDMYVASNIDNKAFNIFQEIRSKEESDAEFRYKGVAVIRKNSNIKSINSLKGAKSCHTGVGRNVGYKIPLTKLIKAKVIPPLGDNTISPRENELRAFSTFFSKACIVGKWMPDEATNRKLKTQYANLCALCEHPEICDYPDENSGYEGALNCLTKAGGDVAWTKTIYVEQYFKLKEDRRSDAADYAYLCPDGSRVALGETPCTWAARPWPGFVADSKLNDVNDLRKEILKLNKLGDALLSDWFTMVLHLSNTSVVVNSANLFHPYEYLTKAKYYDVIGRDVISPRRTVRWCVTSTAALDKCKSLKMAAYSRDIRPEFDCVLEMSLDKCLQTIRDGGADIISIDAARALQYTEKYNLKAIAAEVYFKNTTYLDAIAVIKKNSQINSIEDLRGKKSCHSSYSYSSGWVAPIYWLLQNNIIEKDNCPYSKAFLEFFSGGSCVGNFKRLEIMDNFLPNMTSICDGKSSSGNEDNRDPLKCLLYGPGDIAFTNHIAVQKSIELGKIKEEDIQLLCPNGTLASISEYQDCNIGQVPPVVILTSNQKNEVELDEVRNALLAASNLYGSKPELFKLFGRYKKQNHLLLSNAAEGIRLIDDLDSLISGDFRKKLQDLYYCETKASSPTVNIV